MCVRPPELEEVLLPIVGGLDIHRKQITFDYLDTVTGQVCRGQIVSGLFVAIRQASPPYGCSLHG